MFETQNSNGFFESKGADFYSLYTDILLGTQTWRRNLLDDINELETIALAFEGDEKLKYEYLMGRTINIRYMPMEFDMMAFDGPMMMEAMAFDGGGKVMDNAPMERVPEA